MSKKQSTRPPILEGPFDLAVVGGGINGAAIARDAALRGKSVLLIDKGDFAGGTSSASSKMVHGGIRYLEQLRLGLVCEALRERHLLLKLAPHLVRPQSFLIPVYSDSKRGPRTIRLGLFLYDLLSLGRRLGKSTFILRSKVRDRVPELLADGLLGAGVYHDAVMDDARLCLANAIGAVEEGGRLGISVEARNYTEMVRHEPASPIRVVVRDRLAGQGSPEIPGSPEMIVLAHRLVHALGPWTEPERLVRSKGVHLVLPPLPIQDGLLLTHSRDGRIFFVVPWLGRTVVGTTETPVDGSPDDLRVEPEEVNYLLEELRRVFPRLQLSRREILATFAGVRPLARNEGFWAKSGLGAVSRVHRIVEEQDGILTVFGGKYTTYRAVAKEVVDRLFPGSRCRTHEVPLPGGEGGSWQESRKTLAPEIERHGEREVERLFRGYGVRLRHVLRLIEEDPSLGERLTPESPELRAEVVHAVRHEFAVYPADFLARRTTLRYSGDGGRSAYDAVEALIKTHAQVVPADLPAARERYFKALEWEEKLRS